MIIICLMKYLKHLILVGLLLLTASQLRSQCPPPSNPVVLAYSNISLKLDWTSGGANQWQIRYRLNGSTAPFTKISAASKPFVLTGLNPNSGYQIQVRDSCGPNNLSLWRSFPANILTACRVVSAPFKANFDGAAWNPTTGAINSCWRRFNSDVNAPSWVTGPPSFIFNTGASNDHTSGTGNYLFTDRGGFFAAGPDSSVFESPLFDLSPLNQPQLIFWYHMFGADIEDLKVYISKNLGETYQRIDLISGQQQSSSTEAWKERVLSLSAFANDTVRFRFVGHEQTVAGFTNAICIDDFELKEAPSCPKPSNLHLLSSTSSSLSLDWTSGGAQNWELEYGAVGFSPGNGTRVAASIRPFRLTGLNANTSYDIYLRDSCAAGDVSVWIGPLNARTNCAPVATPYTEDFESGGFNTSNSFNGTGSINNCWLRNTSVSYFWKVGPPRFTPTTTGPQNDHTAGGTQYLYSEVTSFLAPDSAVIESPLIDLGGLNKPELSFWVHLFGADIGALETAIDNGQGWTVLNTQTSAQQNSKTDAWKEILVNLSAYKDDTIKLRFTAIRLNGGGFSSDIAIDDLSIAEAPACPRPTQLQASTVTTNSVQLGWTSGGANLWQIEYGIQGFTPGNGTLLNTSTNPITITGLSSNTTYQFRVRDSCGSSGVSAWTPLLSGLTKCAPVTAPMLENFDGSTFSPAGFAFALGQIDPCWKRSDTVNFTWNPFQGASPLFNSGPSQDHTTGSGQYLMSNRLSFGGGLSTELTSLPIDLSVLTVPELRFYYHLFGTEISSLEIQIDEGSGFTTLKTINGTVQNASTDPWSEELISLSAYANDTVRIKFISTRNSIFGSRVGAAIDDFEIRETPSCPRPTNLALTASTPNSITLDWTSGGATNWQLQYRQNGASSWTSISVNSKPQVINGLSPATGYQFRVRDSCSATDISLYSALFLAYTSCGIITMPFLENFDGPRWSPGNFTSNIGNQIDSCWSRPLSDGLNFGPWSGATITANTGPSQDISGTGKYIHSHNNSFNQTQIGRITTPGIAINNNHGSPQLKYAYHMFGVNVVKLEVFLKRQGGTFQLIKTINGAQQTSSSAAWKTDSFDLSKYIDDTVQVRFIAESNGFRGDIALDEVQIKGNGVICDSISNLSLSNPTATSVDLSWTSNNGNSVSNIRYYPSGQAGNAQLKPGVSSPYTLTGLSSETQYTIAVFDSCGQSYSLDVQDTISTLPCDTVSGSFTFTTSYLGVSFSSTLSSQVDSVFWRFGDGSTDTARNPFHSYAAPGAYPVKLYCYNSCGAGDTISRLVKICDTLRIDFNFTLQNDTLRVNASNSKNATGYLWDFDDGLSGSGRARTVVYPQSGTKQVTLTIFNGCGDTLTLTKTIQVCLAPKAHWSYSVLPPINSGLRIQFDASASQNANSYSWDFGDGNSGTGLQPIHIYSTPGLFYKVTLTVSNACGKSDKSQYQLNQISVDELGVQDLSLFPNPSSGRTELRWNLNQGRLLHYRLVDALGRALQQGSLDEAAGEKVFEFGHYPAGAYRLLLLSEHGQLSLPLILH